MRISVLHPLESSKLEVKATIMPPGDQQTHGQERQMRWTTRGVYLRSQGRFPRDGYTVDGPLWPKARCQGETKKLVSPVPMLALRDGCCDSRQAESRMGPQLLPGRSKPSIRIRTGSVCATAIQALRGSTGRRQACRVCGSVPLSILAASSRAVVRR
jgi:hypothetical protein